MSAPKEKIRDDFDRIARASADAAPHASVYDDFLLRHLPVDRVRVLEIGCGTGAFSRRLAARGHDVRAVDLSPEMIRVARRRTPPSLAVAYECADFLDPAFAGGRYDAVVSVATLHHMEVAAAVPRMASMVRPGGVLVVHDLRSDAWPRDLPLAVAALVARAWYRARTGQLRQPAPARAAWDAHGRGERYATLDEVRAWAQISLQGARIFRHLQWRYTVVWQAPGAP